jgi:phytoene dehydrogenase-like protein
MTQKSIIVIGAGIAGLAAGCYGQMNGYRTVIYEMGEQPGGLCAAWKRKGYTFDGCIHWLMGASPRSPYYKMWQELGVTDGRRMISHAEFVRISDESGKTLIVYTSTDRLEQHLLELSPEDAPLIRDLAKTLRRWSKVDLTADKPAELMNAADKIKSSLKMAPRMPEIMKWMKTSVSEYAARFSDPFLRRALPMIFGGDIPMMIFLMFLAPMDHGDCGTVEGGSWGFSHAIEKRCRDLGGEIHYGARVDEILVEPCKGRDGKLAHRATGVRLADGTVRSADYVISAADGRTTVFKMLGGKFVDDHIRHAYDAWPTFTAVTQVSIGVGRDLSDTPHNRTQLLPRPIELNGRPVEALNLRHFCFDRSLAPLGRSVVVSFFQSDYDYWKRLAEVDRERYEAEKQLVATRVIEHLEATYPGITGAIEAIDVATPLTTERYTGNYKGSIQGWGISPETTSKGMKRTLPGLENFYMAGQWVSVGGGLPGVAPSGRDAIRIICHDDGKKFVTGLPT